MRSTVSLLALALLAACSQGERGSGTTDVTEARAPGEAVEAPGIAPTAAPGVAFNYRYAFRLPSERIAAVQEQHAQACEQLGIERCRITGMRYRLINDRDIQAMLAFRLDPTIARQFGKQGIDAVGKAEGMLVDSEISGEDVGSKIAATDRSSAQMREDLERIEQQLKAPGLKSAERAELQSQAQSLRETIRAAQASQADRRESLATTPVVFQYGSGNLAPGFDTRPSLKRAAVQAGENFMSGVSLLLVLLITLLPWAAALGLAVWLALWLRRRFGFATPTPEAAE